MTMKSDSRCPNPKSERLEKNYSTAECLTDDARHENVPLQNLAIKGMIEVNSGINRSKLYHMRYIVHLDCS